MVRIPQPGAGMMDMDAVNEGPTYRECAGCAGKPGSPTLCPACLHNRDTIARLVAELEVRKPIPLYLTCPKCGTQHVDRGEFATKPHHTHSCQGCGLTWRPAIVATVGVQFLPGFKDPEP